MRFDRVINTVAIVASLTGGVLAASLGDDVVQDASNSDGNPDEGEGEAPSKTSDENFINFCAGKTITNGKQNEGGSCNGIPMGDIPATDSMTASLVVNPGAMEDLDEDKDITFKVQMRNFAPGTFTNADTAYYTAPQQLKEGKIVGHTHITVQKMNSIDDKFPPDAQQFAFFKGVNDEGNGKGLLSATAAGGLPAGTYRVCTMAAAANHQPVLMPVAQRGAQDDCQKFTVGGGDDNNNKRKRASPSAGENLYFENKRDRYNKQKRSFVDRLS